MYIWYICVHVCVCASACVMHKNCMRRTIRPGRIKKIVYIYCTAPELNEIAWCLNAHLFEWNEWMEQTYATYVFDHHTTGSFAVHTLPCTYACTRISRSSSKHKQRCRHRIPSHPLRIHTDRKRTLRYATRQSILFPLYAFAIHSIQFRIWPTSVRVRCSYRTDQFSFFLCSVHFLLKLYLVERRERTIKMWKN